MSDEETTIEVLPEGKGDDDTPIYPALPDVPLPEKRRAWCVVTVIEMQAVSGKPHEAAQAVVKAASIIERYLDKGTKQGPELTAVEKN